MRETGRRGETEINLGQDLYRPHPAGRRHEWALTRITAPLPAMQFVVSTHSRLLRIDLDAHWRITDMAVLADGPHYGIALAPQPLPGIIAKSNTCDLTAYDLSQGPNRARCLYPTPTTTISIRSLLRVMAFTSPIRFITH